MKKISFFSAISLMLLFSLFTNINAAKPENTTARFYFKGNKGLAPHVCLYKIDNKTREEYTSGFLAFGYNKSHKIGGFDIELSPGKHSFEIALNDKGVSSKPKKILVKKLTLEMKVGCEYIMELNDFELNVICETKDGNVSADFTLEDAPIYKEPAESFALIKYNSTKKSEIDPFISRIDDMITSGLGDISGSCNYSLPVDFKYFSGLKGELNIKISPGTHKIEMLMLGEGVFDGLVQIETFDFIAGKKYDILIEKTKVKGKMKFLVKFVEV